MRVTKFQYVLFSRSCPDRDSSGLLVSPCCCCTLEFMVYTASIGGMAGHLLSSIHAILFTVSTSRSSSFALSDKIG